MSDQQKVELLDKLAEDKEGIGFVIVCRRGTERNVGDSTTGILDECFVCDHSIVCFRASAEKKKDGFFLLCRECFSSLVARWNAKGTPVEFIGRVQNNKFPENL